MDEIEVLEHNSKGKRLSGGSVRRTGEDWKILPKFDQILLWCELGLLVWWRRGIMVSFRRALVGRGLRMGSLRRKGGLGSWFRWPRFYLFIIISK